MNRSPVRACWLGSTGYREAWDLQVALVDSVRSGASAGTLLLLEHPHVFTMGRAASPSDLLWDEEERHLRGIDTVWSDRGGEATYHGPGQLVGYPVVDLSALGFTIPAYIAGLEASLIGYLAELGIDASPGDPGLTGVWARGEKVAAIGIKLNGSVVSHGFALNLSTDIANFDGIVPCGHADLRPVSVVGLGGPEVAVLDAAKDYAAHFSKMFRCPIEWADAVELRSEVNRSTAPVNL